MPKRGYSDLIDPTKRSAVSMEERIGRDTKKLAEADRRGLGDQIAQREEEIRAKKELNPNADVSDMQREIDHKKMILQHDDDLVPKTDTQRDKLYRRGKEIEDILKKEMPNKREMWPKVGSSEAQQAVRHNLQFQEKRGDLCREWQDIQQKLNPDDPYAQSLELIRPE